MRACRWSRTKSRSCMGSMSSRSSRVSRWSRRHLRQEPTPADRQEEKRGRDG